MASLKKLAGQTLWYGLSNIAAKLLFQLQTPLVTYLLSNPSGMMDYGNFGTLFSVVSLLNVVYTYGMETAYFRFSSAGEDKQKLFRTAFSSLLISTVLLSAIITLFRGQIADLANLKQHTEYIIWCLLIIAFDTLSAIPFARLRQEERPKKYAFVRVAGIVVNLIVLVTLMAIMPGWVAAHPGAALSRWYLANNNVGFMILANVAQSAFTFIMLYKEWIDFRFTPDKALWKRIVTYGAPMVLVGLGGMVNETIDRIMLPHLYGTSTQGQVENSIYTATYKIAIFITLFITAFRMSAEPFFFNQAKDKNAPGTYARVMKWFVVVLCCAFLSSALFLDGIKYFLGPAFRNERSLGVVPILLGANVCLGIYYNLSVWYKLTDRMRMGMYITMFGAALTLTCNTLFIPQYGMYACAWTTFAAYCSMMLISYFLGQKYFPVPYNMKKLLSYLGVMLLLFFAQKAVGHFTESIVIRLGAATVFMLSFISMVVFAEKEELKGLPVVGKYIR